MTLTLEDAEVIKFRLTRMDHQRLQTFTNLRDKEQVPAYGKAREASGFGPRERAESARRERWMREQAEKQERIRQFRVELVKVLDAARETWPVAVSLNLPSPTADSLAKDYLVEVNIREKTWSRPEEFILTVGYHGDRTRFKKRQDGTWNWKNIANAYWGRLTAQKQREEDSKKTKSIRDQNAPAAEQIKAQFDLNWAKPFSIEPSVTKANHVIVRVNSGFEMTPERATEVLEGLKKLGLLK